MQGTIKIDSRFNTKVVEFNTNYGKSTLPVNTHFEEGIKVEFYMTEPFFFQEQLIAICLY